MLRARGPCGGCGWRVNRAVPRKLPRARPDSHPARAVVAGSTGGWRATRWGRGHRRGPRPTARPSSTRSAMVSAPWLGGTHRGPLSFEHGFGHGRPESRWPGVPMEDRQRRRGSRVVYESGQGARAGHGRSEKKISPSRMGPARAPENPADRSGPGGRGACAPGWCPPDDAEAIPRRPSLRVANGSLVRERAGYPPGRPSEASAGMTGARGSWRCGSRFTPTQPPLIPDAPLDTGVREAPSKSRAIDIRGIIIREARRDS